MAARKPGPAAPEMRALKLSVGAGYAGDPAIAGTVTGTHRR
jgi:hypothetical protein